MEQQVSGPENCANSALSSIDGSRNLATSIIKLALSLAKIDWDAPMSLVELGVTHNFTI